MEVESEPASLEQIASEILSKRKEGGTLMMKGYVFKHTLTKAEEDETGRVLTRLTSLPSNHQKFPDFHH
jgi:hypothetical protein